MTARNTRTALKHATWQVVVERMKTMIKEIGKVMLVAVLINAPFWAHFAGWL